MAMVRVVGERWGRVADMVKERVERGGEDRDGVRFFNIFCEFFEVKSDV